MSDQVNHPSHYNMSKIEVIDAVEAWELGFCLGNAVKYIARAEHKGNEIADLKKAFWYVTRELVSKYEVNEKELAEVVLSIKKELGQHYRVEYYDNETANPDYKPLMA